jgi:3-oxoadipate enol-lactonase
MARYFHDGYRLEKAATVARFRRRLTTTDAAGYVGCCAAVGMVDTTSRLARIAAPALVIAGELDQGTPVAMAETLVEGMPNASLTVLKEASHLSAIEQPAAFAAAVTTFIDGL